MKDISFRPTNLILSLFEQIRKLDNLPSTDRNSITHRAMTMALEDKSLDWKFVSTIQVEESFEGSIPKHIVLKIEEEKFNLINAQLKNVFGMEKITIPYTLKLLLVNYLSSFNQSDVTSTQVAIPQDINLLFLKNDYAQSTYLHKRRLFSACKAYLKVHINLQADLNGRAIKLHGQLNHFDDLRNYFPDKRTEFGTPTTTYLAKILAGWFIFMVESQYDLNEEDEALDYIVKRLENELELKDESPFEKIRAKKDAGSAEYYKNVYARMMSK